MAEGSRRGLFYVAESAWGTTPGTPTMKTLRNTGGSGIALERSQLQSQEMRSDRAIADIAFGQKRASLEVPFEFSYGSYDDMLEAALFGAFAVAYAITGLTVDVDATAKTFTRSAGSFITDGVKVGDKITFGGFTNAGNNGTFVVTDVAALVVTCSAATGLANVTDDTEVTATTDRFVLKQGVTKKSFTIEEGFLDVDQHQVMTGAMADSLSLNIAPDQIITGNMRLIGKVAGSFSATPLDESPDAASTTPVFNSFSGSIKENAVAISYISALSLNLANALAADFALFQDEAFQVGVGRANLSGSLSAYFPDAILANKAIAGTDTSLEFTLSGTSGSYRFTIPRLKLAPGSKQIEENKVIQTYNWQALHSSTLGTCLQIERIPA